MQHFLACASGWCAGVMIKARTTFRRFAYTEKLECFPPEPIRFLQPWGYRFCAKSWSRKVILWWPVSRQLPVATRTRTVFTRLHTPEFAHLFCCFREPTVGNFSRVPGADLSAIRPPRRIGSFDSPHSSQCLVYKVVTKLLTNPAIRLVCTE